MDPTIRPLQRLYFGFAFLSLATAGAMLALEPAGLAGFFYHPRMLALVHLITLGWLTSSRLGLLHFVAPGLLGKPLPASKVEFLVFGLFFLSSSGMVGHFWIGEMSGVGWSGALVVLVVLRIGVRFVVELGDVSASGSGTRPFVPKGFTLCCLLAVLNLVGAATLGMAIVLDRYVEVLPGFVLHHVFAHAHLATLGWATMLLLGLVGALSAVSPPPNFTAGALVLELATLSLAAAFLTNMGRGPAALAAALAVLFLATSVFSLRGGRGIERSLANFELRQAFFYLGLTCILGVSLAFIPGSAFKLRLFMVYGTFGLLGFLGALPLAFLRSFDGAEDSSWRTLGRWFWSLSVPFLAVGFAWEFLPALRAGGVALVAAAGVAWRQPWPTVTRNQFLRNSP